MKRNKKNITKVPPKKEDNIEHLWDKSWMYIHTIVDVMREPVLILNEKLEVMVANDSFYRAFQVELKDTEGNLVYKLGNGQWNIPALRKLLEDILPHNTFFKGFEVIHDFPFIGRKVMILNAKQIHFKEDTTLKKFPPIILLAIEDVTDIMMVAETIALHTKVVESKLLNKTQKLEKEIKLLRKKI